MTRSKRTKQEAIEEPATTTTTTAASNKRPKRGQAATATAAAATAAVEEAAAVAAAVVAANEPSIEEAAAKAAGEAVATNTTTTTSTTKRSSKKKALPKKDDSTNTNNTPPPPDAYQGCQPPDLNPHDPENFDHFLVQLLSFKADTNNYHVPKDEFPQLHSWLQFLKREYKSYCILLGEEQEGDHHNEDDDDDDDAKQAAATSSPDGPTTCVLTGEQLKVLRSLHVPLTSRGDDHWNRFFQLLQDYKDRHGHVLVPRLCEVPGLGDWVTDQRRQYKNWKQGGSTQLTADRRAKLQELGFVWQVRNRPEWDHRFNELVAYKEKHGDCKVPQHFKENKALGKWVAKQREQYKLLKKREHSFLTPYRLEKLNNVGFVWQVRTSMDSDDIAALAESTPAKAAGKGGDDEDDDEEEEETEAAETPAAEAEAAVEAAAKQAVDTAETPADIAVDTAHV